MTDEDYIRKAIALADRWTIKLDYVSNRRYYERTGGLSLSELDTYDLAALAAQLVEQIDATDWKLHVYPKAVIICDRNDKNYTHISGDDRIMNTIKASVDSKVLEALSE